MTWVLALSPRKALGVPLSLKLGRQEVLSAQGQPASPSHPDCPAPSASSPASASILPGAWGGDTAQEVVSTFVSNAAIPAKHFLFLL